MRASVSPAQAGYETKSQHPGCVAAKDIFHGDGLMGSGHEKGNKKERGPDLSKSGARAINLAYSP